MRQFISILSGRPIGSTLQLPSIGIIALLVAFASCSTTEPPTDHATPPASETTVTLTPDQLKNAAIVTAKAEHRSLGVLMPVQGVVDVPPQNLVSVSAPLGGYLRSTDLLPGMEIQKGQTLAIMEDPRFIQLQQDYLVTEGKVKLGRTSSDGRENLLAILGPGRMFGDLPLFDPGPGPTTVTAWTTHRGRAVAHASEAPRLWYSSVPSQIEPIQAPCAPRAREAAICRPEPMPPAPSTGTSGPTASTMSAAGRASACPPSMIAARTSPLIWSTAMRVAFQALPSMLQGLTQERSGLRHPLRTTRRMLSFIVHRLDAMGPSPDGADVVTAQRPGAMQPPPVSYTHLTLPTSDLVEISVVAVSLKKKNIKKKKRAEARTQRSP